MQIRNSLLFAAVALLSLPAQAITRSWTGATSANWSDATNWSPAGLPAAEDTLVFPAGVARTQMHNDLPAGSPVGPMDFRTGYTLDGNPLTVTGNLSFDQSTYPHFVSNVELRLGADVTFGAAITSTYNGRVVMNGHTLTVHSYNTRFGGAIDGTGSIFITGSGASLAGGGTFTGTIDGIVDVTGSMPAAAIIGGLSGTGTVGAVTIGKYAAPLHLGSKDPCCGDPHTIGTLRTGSIHMLGGMFVDLVPAGLSDRLEVTGTVTLGGQALWLTVASGAISAGQSFTLIDNDGADGISGTFEGKPEGAQFSLGGAMVTITYAGGDGNDVVLTSTASTKSWTGAVSGLWSNPGNWSPAAVPAGGEDLIFPGGVARTVMTNDLPAGTSVGAMEFRANYTLGGNALTLHGDVTFDPAASVRFVCNAELRLATDVRLGAAITSDYGGAILVNGHALTIDTYNTRITGPIEGPGSIVATGSGISIASSGGFSGTVQGTVDLVGSMPNATFTGALSGNGATGPVTVTGGMFGGGMYLGTKDPCCAAANTIGTLATKSIALHGPLYADLVPGGTSDLLSVTGTVTLDGSALGVSVPAGAVGADQVYTVIDNDGADAVSGTFAGLPEGAEVKAGTAFLTISYQGGDGNDVVLSSGVSTKSWTGAASGLWSDPQNWSPKAVPVAGEDLVFPAGVTRTDMTNDLPSHSVGALHFGASYTLSGNALTLLGNWTFDQSTYTNFVSNVPLRLGADLTLGAAITSQYAGAIDVNGHTLTIDAYNTRLTGAIDGAGTIRINGSGISIASSGSFRGTIEGIVDVVGSMPDAAIVGGLSGSGSVGDVTIAAGMGQTALYPGSKDPCCADSHNVGTLQTKSITLGGHLFVDLVSAASSDQIQVTGTVTLGGPISTSVPTGSPAAGQTFTIIDNDGTDPVSGTFLGLPEDSFITQLPWKYRITYAGGDGNDVVLTAVEATVTAPSQTAPTSQFGEGATFTAAVTARVGVPDGNVTFVENGSALATVPLVQGLASFAQVVLEPGVHTVNAVYDGTPLFAPSAGAITHEVKRGKTATGVTSTATSIVYGDPVPLSVSVTPVAPAFGTPTGGVTLKSGGTTIASASLAQGGASVTSSAFNAGVHQLTAVYGGDRRFEGSTSTASTLTVRKAATATQATVSARDGRVSLNVSVTATERPALPVVGTVKVSENGTVLAQRAVASGPFQIDLGALSTGDHQLLISFLGGDNFDASSASVSQTIEQPALTMDDAVVTESNSGEVLSTITFELSTATTSAVIVTYASEDGTAIGGEDYRGVSGTLVFAPGETAKSITVAVYGDTTQEEDEAFEVKVSSVANASVGSPSAKVTIANDDFSYRVSQNLVYATRPTGPVTLDLYTPIDGDGPFPLIVWVPGTTAYDALGALPPAIRETSRGYVVAVVRYRSATTARFPAQIEDLRAAVKWLRENARTHKTDPRNIGVWGSGAGAHLASLLGTMNDVSLSDSESSEVQAVVVWGGASDLLRLQSDGKAAGCGTQFDDRRSPQSLLIGCALQTCAPSASAASPLSFVTRNAPPFLIMHGTNDCGVPMAQGIRLHDALRAAGGESTLLTFPGGVPWTWTSARPLADAEAFLDRELKSRLGKRRAVR